MGRRNVCSVLMCSTDYFYHFEKHVLVDFILLSRYTQYGKQYDICIVMLEIVCMER